MNQALLLLPKQTKQQLYDELGTSHSGVGHQMVDTAQIVVALMDDHGVTVAEISEIKGIPEYILSNYEKIGRGQLAPYLLVSDYEAADPLKRLCYSEQTRLGNEPVDVLIQGPDGPASIQIRVQDLTRSQCKQVFDKTRVRSLDAQQAFIESNRRKPHAPSKPIGGKITYEINRDGTVTFHKGYTATKVELQKILTAICLRG